ncbi:MAG: hypothetical protein R2825_06135 [Saprospiraceae bacterium]
MKTFTLLFLLFFSFQLSAQNTAADSLLMNIRSFRFSIFDALEFNSNSFLLSYEHQINRHLSLLAEAGPTIGSAFTEKIKRKRTYGPKMRFELRGYGKVKVYGRFYVGLQYMHKRLEGEDFENSFKMPRTRTKSIRYEYDYLKTVNALHVTAGVLSISRRKMLFDYGLFVGFRHKQLKAVGVPENLVIDTDYEYTPFQPFEIVPFDNMRIDYGFVIRIGIGLKYNYRDFL